jgi:hypothetical protein
MKKLAAFYLLIFFANTLCGHSMFMLSIEKGDVYTECYNLNHILKSAYSLPEKNPDKTRPVYGSGRFLSHHHIQLSKNAIPESPHASNHGLIFSGIDSLPAYPAFPGFFPASPLQKLFSPSRLLKIPFTPLSQASVLLI